VLIEESRSGVSSGEATRDPLERGRTRLRRAMLVE
jgi:hypothetical protein